MMSLDNAVDEAELGAWSERLRAGPRARPRDVAFSGEPKVDGLAMSLTYERGASSKLRRVVTASPART